MAQGELDWSEMVANLLRTTGQIDNSYRLGQENVNEWSKVRVMLKHAPLLIVDTQA